jgi:hypothetical protein
MNRRFTKALKICLTTSIFLLFQLFGTGQVKISDNPASTQVVDVNAILELESINKGIIPPRVTLIAYNNASPLTAPVVYGTLIYNSAGSLPTGYYVWEGAWKMIGGSTFNIVTKNTSGAIGKSETMVLAEPQSAAGWLLSLTLPQISAADNGLSITVKNTGGHRGLVSLQGFGGSTTSIDGTSALLARYESETFVAHNGVWLLKQVRSRDRFVFNVCAGASWTDPEEMVEFLDEHLGSAITQPCVVRLCAGTYTVNNTLTLNFPHPVTFESEGGKSAILKAGTSLGSNPIFNAQTSVTFRNLRFEGTNGTEDAIRISGLNLTNYEISDVVISGFSRGIRITGNSKLLLQDAEILNCGSAGLLVDDVTGNNTTGVSLLVTGNTFSGNNRALDLNSGRKAIISASNNYFSPGAVTKTVIRRNETSFINIQKVSVSGNTWDNSGIFITGIDFTRQDGRDADFQINDNSGYHRQNAFVHYNVLNNSSTTNGSSNTWRKANFNLGATSYTSGSFLVENNRFTYLSSYPSDCTIQLAGMMYYGTANRNLDVVILLNGSQSILYGITSTRNNTNYYPFSTNAFIPNLEQDDYLEVYVRVNQNNPITIQYLNLTISTH